MSFDAQFILLRHHKLFRQLTYKECSELNIVSGFMRRKKGEIIFLDSFTDEKLYFLKKGYIKIGYIDEKGEEHISEILNQGDIFGQITLEKGGSRSEYAEVLKSEAIICSFTIQDFEAILQKRPDLAISYTKLVGFRLRTIQTRMSGILKKDVRSRFLDLIHYLVMKLKEDAKGEVVLDNFLTHAEMASLVGASRQTITTLLADLENENILKVDRKFITVPDYGRLVASIR